MSGSDHWDSNQTKCMLYDTAELKHVMQTVQILTPAVFWIDESLTVFITWNNRTEMKYRTRQHAILTPKNMTFIYQLYVPLLYDSYE